MASIWPVNVSTSCAESSRRASRATCSTSAFVIFIFFSRIVGDIAEVGLHRREVNICSMNRGKKQYGSRLEVAVSAASRKPALCAFKAREPHQELLRADRIEPDDDLLLVPPPLDLADGPDPEFGVTDAHADMDLLGIFRHHPHLVGKFRLGCRIENRSQVMMRRLPAPGSPFPAPHSLSEGLFPVQEFFRDVT